MTIKVTENLPAPKNSKAISEVRKEFDRAKSETLKALGRLGEKPIQVLSWLVLFSQKEMSSLSAGDALNLQYEVAAFCTYGIQTRGTAFKFQLVESPDIAWEVPEWDEIIKIQEYVQDKFNHIIEGNHIPLALSNLRIDLYVKEDGNDHGGQLVFIADDHLATFQYHLIQLLAEYAGLIRRCPECQKIFLADRSNQVFCSMLHQARQATRKRRNTPPDRIGKRGRPPKAITSSKNPVQIKDERSKKNPKMKKAVTKEKTHGTKKRKG